MRLPVESVQDYLNTPEMYETIQSRLNEDEEVVHDIIGTSNSIQIQAFHDEDLDIKWTIYKDYLLGFDNIETTDLLKAIKAVDSFGT